MKKNLDIASNRTVQKYSYRELTLRVLWGLASVLFRLSPRVLFSWRCFLLRVFGAKVGRDVHIYPSTRIYMPWNLEIGDWSAIGENATIYNLGSVQIGKAVTVSQGAHLCAGTHDYKDPALPLLKLPIVIESQAWICADAFIGPDVTVGEGAVAGARAVVTKNIAPWTVVAGNPAKFVKQRKLVS